MQDKTIQEPLVIAEIGCNHCGNFDTAIKMIKIASEFCKADVVKFQKRCNKELLTYDEYNNPHPNPINSFGKTYGEHREFLEFDLEQNIRLKEVCEDYNVVFSTSVWDPTSAKEIISIDPKLIKVPSAINTDRRVLDILFNEFPGQIHISLGMTTREEEIQILNHADKLNCLNRVVLYHCISGYPVENNELYLLEISRLKNLYGDKVLSIGFSGHHKGIAVDLVAYTLGAKWFERHFTLDRTQKGTDHSASLEPDGLRRLKRDLKAASVSLLSKPSEIIEVENFQRKKLKKYYEID